VIVENHGDIGAGGSVAPGKASARNLTRRIRSACVMVPLALGATYLGGWAFTAICLIAASAVLWEWASLKGHPPDTIFLTEGLLALVLAAALAGQGKDQLAIAVILVGVVLAAAAPLLPRRPMSALSSGWGAGGVIYAGVVLLCPVFLRNDPQFGLQALLFLFAIVWATDILAYFVGRAVGGPLLWQQVSPNKTWSGAVGGLLGGVAAGIAVAYASGGPRAAVAGVLALILSIVAQAGDLFESAVKRRFGIKDASNLIPGHGGMMDRLDGFLVAALAAVLIGILRQGMTQGLAAPARGLLAW
jgi:phosphatidate cytidylyltransferase